ncbi:YSIRK-targeted surface antigen transcriptional regulator [Streptococcus thoraltensis]|uniref:YSIRK-targeted surface antigen transcriptional regulator n=1 Tax=Streptococcus thoraltensis TaxID=55085 RepID=UPI0004781EFF|nr:YSIRK-targeted surface antigen transcriptional regulator [Streptococcus thoraltensis]
MMDLLLLKSLHSSLGLSVIIFDKSFRMISEFCSDKTGLLYYNYYQILTEFNHTDSDFLFYSGPFNEMLLAYQLQEKFVIIGPWRSNNIDETFFKNEMERAEISSKEQSYFFKSLNTLPFFSGGQIRELLVLINFCFTGVVEDRLSQPLHEYTAGWVKSFDLEKIKHFSKNHYTAESYLYEYECKIIQAVQTGELEQLQDVVRYLSNAVAPKVSGDMLRSEKNYSITVFDRLSQVAIQSGLDVETAYLSRDSFIRDSELMTSIPDVIKLRDASIVFYTTKIGEIKQKLASKTSPTIIAIIQYLENNLDKNIETSKVAAVFHMSESKIRKLFKTATNSTIQQYVLGLKIKRAKVFLKEGERISDIADVLGFSSPSNFSRSFKKLVGESPIKYKQKYHTGNHQE